MRDWIRTSRYGFAFATSVFAATLMIPAAAQEPVATTSAESDGGYWTPARLQAAQSLDLPLAEASLDETIDGAMTDLLAIPAESVAADGALPLGAEEIQPDLDARLFPIEALPQAETDDMLAVPENVGTQGAYFSSSRLIPTSARLTYPYRPNGKLFFTIPGRGDTHCSAAVIGPRLIATAGHCVHSGSGGQDGFYENFLFVPSHHRGDAPFGEWDWAYVITTGPWSVSGGDVPNRADFAILEAVDNLFDGRVRKIGEVTGWLGWRTNALFPNHTKKIGYPQNLDQGEIQHQVDSESFSRAEQGTVLYGSDMSGGSSGGAWIENFGRTAAGQTEGRKRFPNHVVGITSYGFRNRDGSIADLLVQGSSTLNDYWIEIWGLACENRRGNCS